MEEKNKMALMPIRKLLYTMAVPLMMSLLIQSLYNIVDSMFVARLSEKALTATSLVYTIQMLMIAIGVGTAVGLNALLSRKVGEKKYEEACRVATTGLLLMLITSIIFSLIGIFFSETIAWKMTNDSELQGLCEDYLSISLIFGWGIFIQTYGQRLLQAVGDTFLSMISLVVGAVVNMILDPMLIFGLLGCPALGVKGAAIASVIGQMAASATALLLNRLNNPVIHVRLRGYRFVWQDVVAIYQVGLPTIIMQALGSVMTFCMNAILLNVSATAVAFFGVYYKLQNFLMMPMNGLGQAAIPVVGFNYGTGNKDRIRQVWHVLIPTALVFALCGTVVFMVLPHQLLALFAASDAMLAIGIPALRIISVTFALGTVTMMCGYFASGLGNGVINMLGTAFRQLIILVPCVYLLIQTAGLPWAWFAFWIAEAAAFGYSYHNAKRLLEVL
ncbi:MAG: MATE family efflux transporter [Peptococcaceae bacterium]|nr:MATE family efflux transporter [Peptococcaceae bacterium]